MKTVRILGAFNRESDWYLEGTDHWALNNFHSVVDDESQIAAWFQMHPRDQWEAGRNGEEHKAWLKEKHPFPIYMQEQYKGVPSAKKYPKDEADKLWPFSWGPVYSDTFCYMTALAILRGYEAIDYYGVHLTNPIEVYLEAHGLMTWVGIAGARGVKTTGNSRLFGKFEYGYQPRAAPLWLPHDVAALVMIDEYPPLKSYMTKWADLKYKAYSG